MTDNIKYIAIELLWMTYKSTSETNVICFCLFRMTFF